MQILEEIVVFWLDIRLWTGRKKLNPADLAVGGVDPGQLPPETLASLGSKRIVGAEALAPFHAIKREAEKVCLTHGVRFLSGYAVPLAAAPAVEKALAGLREGFAAAKAVFLRGYDQAVAAWVAENPPAWEPVIRAAVDPVSRVGSALAFRYAPVAVSAPEDLGATGELTEPTAGLLGQLCRQVRSAARAAFAASYQGKAAVTRKALRPIHALRQKLAGLAFLDPLLTDAIATIDATLALVPAQGPITGVALNALAGLLGKHLASLGREQAEAEHEDESPVEATSPEGSGEEGDLSAPPADLQGLAPRLPTTPQAPLTWDF